MESNLDTLFVDESVYTSEYAAGFRDLARCAQCQARIHPEHEGKYLMGDDKANLQWVRCAQCRSGTHDWYRP